MDKEKLAEALRKMGHNVKVENETLRFFYPDDVTTVNNYICMVAFDLHIMGYMGDFSCEHLLDGVKEEEKE